MPIFIETTAGFVNLDRVRRMEPLSNPNAAGLPSARLQLDDGTKAVARYDSVESIAERAAPIVADQNSGIVVLFWQVNQLGVRVRHSPPLAWRVGGLDAIPVCAKPPIVEDETHYALLMPDGTVDVPGEARYESEADFRAVLEGRRLEIKGKASLLTVVPSQPSDALEPERSDTLEPVRPARGFGIKTKWPGVAIIALGAIVLLAGAGL